MSRHPLLLLFALLLIASTALADLRIGAPVRVSTPAFEPVPIFASIGLTESDGRFLATWSRAREAVRLDFDGDPLDLPPLELLPEPPLSQRSEHAVSDGSGWLIVTRSWQDPGASALIFDRVSADGAASRAGEIGIPRSFGPLDVAGSDGKYAALFALEGGVTAGIITFDAALRASAPLIVDGLAVAIAAGADGFAALLRDRVLLIGPSGSLTGSVPLPAGIDPRAIAAVGSSYVVASVDGSSIVLHRIDGGGALPIARFDAAIVVELVMGASGDRVLLLWSGSEPGSENPPALLAARASLGGATERPVFLGESANDVAIAEDREGWLAGWIGAGPANASMFRTRRISAREPLSSIADDVDQVVWDTPAENARAIARSGETALALWSRAGDPISRATIFDSRGRKIVDEIPVPVADGVAGTPDGFLVYGLVPPYAPLASGPSQLLAYRVSLDGVVDPAPIAVAEGRISEAVIECAGDLCLAAWRSSESLSTSAVRVARIRGSAVLDPGGVPVYFPTPPFSSLAIATDGAKFLIAANRTVGQSGSIVNAILVDPSEALSSKAFDVLAANETGFEVEIGWNGASYDVFRSGVTYRLARVAPDGAVLEGEASGWAGWPLEMDGVAAAPFYACGTSWFATFWSLEGVPGSIIYEIGARSARAAEGLPLRIADVVCFEGRSCLALADEHLQRIPRRGERAFAVPLSCERERLVGR